MSGFIRLTSSVEYIDTDRSLRQMILQIPNMQIFRTSRLLQQGIQNIPTTAGGTNIQLGVVTSEWLAVFMNLDQDNYIEIGFDTEGAINAFARLDPYDPAQVGGPTGIPYAILPLNSAKTYMALANTSAADLQYAIFQRNP